MRWYCYWTCLLAISLLLGLAPDRSFSQEADTPEPTIHITNQPPARVGAGLQLGIPAGFSVKNYLSPSVAFTGSLVWDLHTFAFASGHVVYERAIPETPVNVFVGPGVMVGPGGFKDDHDYTIGLNGKIGANIFLGPFEPFVGLTPIITLNVATQGYIGSIFGIRYYP